MTKNVSYSDLQLVLNLYMTCDKLISDEDDKTYTKLACRVYEAHKGDLFHLKLPCCHPISSIGLPRIQRCHVFCFFLNSSWKGPWP